MSNRLFQHVETRKDAMGWLRAACREVGMGFHPDTPACEYVDLRTNLPLFQGKDGTAFDVARARSFDVLGNRVYYYGARFLRLHLKRPKPTCEMVRSLVEKGEVWTGANGQRQFVIAILRDKDGTETVEFLEGDFKPVKRMLAKQFVVKYRKEKR